MIKPQPSLLLELLQVLRLLEPQYLVSDEGGLSALGA
jgi:hypothetical protein